MSRRFFTPSMGVACLALAVALSGTAYAVTRLPANSVGTKQVINHSLQKVDFKQRTLLRGPVGPRGLQGPKGATGPQGVPGEDRHGVHAFEERPDLADRRCPYNPQHGLRERTRTLYGGFTADVPVYVLSSYSSNELNWVVSVQSTGVAGNVWVYSTCFRG